MNRASSALMSLFGVGCMLLWGCQQAPPPPRVPVPPPGDRSAQREPEEIRPLPPPSYDDPGAQPPFYDPPLISQRPPEQRAYVDSWRRVGSPRIALLVNRADDPGDTDALSTKSIDYSAIETIMTDWLAANGQVTLVSLRRLENRPQQANADVLVQVRAQPTSQTPQGPEMRIVAEAINTRGGESIGRAVVDVPPPLDKPQINDYTRFLARKLMDDMAATWNSMPPSTAPAR